MKKFIVLILLGILLTGCGTGNSDGAAGDEVTTGSGNGEPTEGTDESSEGEENGGIVAGDLEPNIMEDGDLVFQYSVKNQKEEKITLEFSSSQRFDFAVETKEGEQIFLYSSVAMFLQAVGEEELQPGEELVYAIDIKEFQLDQDLEAGEYVLRAWLTPMDGPVSEVTMDFAVE